jgi:hypothetical protein
MDDARAMTRPIEAAATEDAEHQVLPRTEADPKPGQWYWVDFEGEDEWLSCVTQVGSNYVKLEGVDRTARVHLDEFAGRCLLEPDADAVLQGQAAMHQREVERLMAEVRATAARLSVSVGPALPAHADAGPSGDARALALHRGDAASDYKADLVLARDQTLPELFAAIKVANAKLGKWLAARLIPLEAQVSALKPATEAIKQRIFAVELYAGLSEEVELVRDGEPAAVGERVRLLQRRCYMDEECLARYEAGGMEFHDLPAFDRWIARPEHMDRILPFQRCVVAFRVRRHTKDREVTSFRAFVRMLEAERLDQLTFLYIRNGEQLYRLSTAVDFGERLFPDLDHRELGGKLYAHVYGDGKVKRLIPERQYLAMVEAEQTEAREVAARKVAAAELPEAERPWVSDWVSRHSQDYHAFTPESVYYDDVARHVQGLIDEHNRLVLVLQGLLDRSPVLSPHPPWSLWSQGGFEQALELVYDASRALTTGAAPDFEAYRRELNAQIVPGSVTVGQEVAWEIAEGEKESERQRRAGSDYTPYRYRPHGDPGPGTLARVVRVLPRAGQCTYVWSRERSTGSGELRRTCAVKFEDLLNVSAYRPGDFRRFFDDPRTRADYLAWAPLLLVAEDYHAGKRQVVEPKVAPKLKRTAAGSAAYHDRKRRKAIVGQAVRLTRPIRTRGERQYEAGSLWRTISNHGAEFTVVGVLDDGRFECNDHGYVRVIRGVSEADLKVDPTVPARRDGNLTGDTDDHE